MVFLRVGVGFAFPEGSGKRVQECVRKKALAKIGLNKSLTAAPIQTKPNKVKQSQTNPNHAWLVEFQLNVLVANVLSKFSSELQLIGIDTA